MLAGIKKAVFFGAHTDDEMICAGTLHRLVRQGCEVHVVTFGPAATKEDRIGGLLSAEIVFSEWQKSLQMIGTPYGRYLNLTPSRDLEELGPIICQNIFEYVVEHKPDAVFYLSPDDENTAHAVIGVQTERVLRGRVAYAIRCPIPWNYSHGRNNLFVSLTQEDLGVKQKVIDCYKSQHWRYQYKEMLLAYCRADGLSVKVQAAEKFELVRGVV